MNYILIHGVTDDIAFYFSFQSFIKLNSFETLAKSDLDDSNKSAHNDFSNILNEIENNFNDSENGENMLLLGLTHKNGGGHCVDIIGGVENIEGKKGYIYIPLYDNNRTYKMYLRFSEDLKQALIVNANDGEDEILYKALENPFTKLTLRKIKDIDIFSVQEAYNDYKENGTKLCFDSDEMTTNYSILLKISNKTGKSSIVKNGINNGNLNCEVHNIESDLDNINESNNKNTVNIMFEENEDYYSVETLNKEDSLDVGMYFGESYITAKTKAGGEATFENKKGAKLKNSTGEEYEVKVALNDEYLTMPWYAITASGSGAKEVQIEMTEEGAVVSGDDLRDLSINGKNDEETVELSAGTEKNEVLITSSKDKEKMIAKVDTDGDGSYDKVIAETEEKSKDEEKDIDNNNSNQEDNTKANQKIPNAGIKTVILVFIAISIVLAIILKFKSKKNF